MLIVHGSVGRTFVIETDDGPVKVTILQIGSEEWGPNQVKLAIGGAGTGNLKILRSELLGNGPASASKAHKTP